MVSVSKLSMSSRCVKYLMFTFNLLFVITGVILISIGSMIHGVYKEYRHFLDDSYFSVPTLLVVIGSIIFFIAFFGCCGAVKENYCMILTFAILMILVFVLEMSGAISGYIVRAKTSDVISSKMQSSMYDYTKSPEIARAWNAIQQTFSCCGTNNDTDWISAFKNHTELADAVKNASLPMTCCEYKPDAVGHIECTTESKNVFKVGCLPALSTFIREHAMQLAGAALTVAIIQTLGIWFSIFLARSIKKSYIYM